MSLPGPMEMVIIAVVAMLVLGPKRLPQLGKSVGGALKEFKDAVNKIHDDGNGHTSEKPVA